MDEYLVVALVLLGVLIVGGRRAGRAPAAPAARAAAAAHRGRHPRPRRTSPARRSRRRSADLSTGVLVEPPPVVEAPRPVRGARADRRAAGPAARPAVPLAERRSARACSALLSRDHLDEDAWEEIEDSLITADVGVERHPGDRRAAARAGPGARHPHRPPSCAALLADELVAALDPDLDRIAADRPAATARPAVRAGRRRQRRRQDHHLRQDRPGAGRRRPHACCSAPPTPSGPPPPTSSRPGAARVGAETVRGPEGGDPASVAFDAVKRGIDTGVDTVLIDTAGRLQNKVGLMDELGKVKRVVEKHGPVDETLLDPRRHHRPERPGAGPGLHRGGRRDRRGADQARRHRQGRHRHRRAAQAGHPGEAGRPRRGPGRPGPVRPGAVRRRAAGHRAAGRDA